MEKVKKAENPAVSAGSSRIKMSGIDDLVSGSIKLYKQHFKKLMLFILVSFASYVPFMLITAWLSVNTNIVVGIILVILFIAAFVAMIYFSVRAQIGMYLTLKNPTMTFKELFKSSKDLFWSFFWLSLLNGILVLLWTLLLIVPGIIFGIFYSFALYLLVFEDVKGMNAIKRSKALVTGYWWGVFGRTMFLFLITIIILLVLSIPFIFLSEGTIMYSIYDSLQSLVWAFITPVFMVFSYLMYKDLRRIKG